MKDDSLLGRFQAWRANNKANLPKLDGELFAMFREGVKDIRQTFNEVMLGSHEHAPEPGAPLNPTQIMTTDDLRPDAFNHDSYERDLSIYANRGDDQSRGIER
jgi:hypothetical protein